MDSVDEIMRLCRLCLVKDGVNIPIFEEQGDIRQIFLKISACLPVKVSREDNLPKNICDGCSCKLETLYQFWNTSANSEKKLMKWLSQGGVIDKHVSDKHSMNIDPVILKQEVVEVPDDRHSTDDDLVPDDLNVSNDAEEYLIQQQQLPYQNVEFQFQQDEFDQTGTEENVVEATTPSRKRRAAAIRAMANMGSEEEDNPDLLEPKIAKTEEESEESCNEDPEPTTFVGVPLATDNEQPGPSGVSKPAADAPCSYGGDSLYSAGFGTSENTDYLMTLSNSKSSSLSDVALLVNAEDQLNDTDRELLNLLATEDDCSDILRKIAGNESFENLINDGSAFEPDSVIASLTRMSDVLVPGQKEKRIGTFKCDHCGKLCTTKKLLKYHLMSHFGIREHSCDICGKSFKHKYEVTVHKLTHAKPSFQCDVCSKMFIHKSHLTSHLRKHTKDFVAYCPECGEGFATQASCRYHLDNRHRKPEHVCDKCGARLSSNSALKEHLLTHEPNYGQERSHVCDLCGKTYLNGRNLRTHLKSHANEKNHHCHICGKSLSSKRGLQIHLKTHMGDKSFVCEFCSKGFTSKEYLTVHQRTHTGDRPFRCETCGKCFTQKTSLNVHTRSHTGERPFKCHCGKSFITKTHLAAHLKTHEASNLDFSYVTQMMI